MRPTAAEVMTTALRLKLIEGMSEVTPKQKATFYGVYPHGVSDDKLPEAYELVRRTLERNDNPA